jgi:hypothetical protein
MRKGGAGSRATAAIRAAVARARPRRRAYLEAAFSFFFAFFSFTVSFGLLVVLLFSWPLGIVNKLLTQAKNWRALINYSFARVQERAETTRPRVTESESQPQAERPAEQAPRARLPAPRPKRRHRAVWSALALRLPRTAGHAPYTAPKSRAAAAFSS